MKLNWESYKAKVESYLDNEEAIVIYIIKTGFEDTYIVTLDDAHGTYHGEIYMMRKEEILTKYGIEVQI